MYNSKIVVAVKFKGRVLRELGDAVALPFGSEYSVLVKNLDSVRLMTTVSVDGQEATDGRLVIAPNSSIELERFIRNGNLESGNRLKFIERTAEIEAHRGIGADDGLIRVESWKERTYAPPPPLPRPPHYAPSAGAVAGALGRLGGLKGGTARASSLSPRFRSQISAKSASARPAHPTSRGSLGITVPGSFSSQRFVPVSGFPLESQSIVIVLRLRGAVEGEPVQEPVTVDYRPECQTCGKSADAPNAQFCERCGTSLMLV